jgi:hypothetical protein
MAVTSVSPVLEASFTVTPDIGETATCEVKLW